MVRQRKQLKPSGAKKARPETTVTLESYSDTRSSLVALPAEIQGIITSNASTPPNNAIQTLYHTIELKIPLRWSRLPSLENLLASSSEGLHYTRCLRVVTKQYRREVDPYPNVDKRPETDEEGVIQNEHESGDEEEVVAEAELGDAEEEEQGNEHNRLFRISHPRTSASNSLNAFVRVLIVKFPPQQLHTLWYISLSYYSVIFYNGLIPGFLCSRWDHACPLDALTLSTLLKYQAASTHTLNFRRYTGSWRRSDLARLTIGGLKTLGIGELGPGEPWATELLARNYQNLRHLRLGSEVLLAKDYAKNGCMIPDGSGDTVDLAELMDEKVEALNKSSTPVVRLESLSLIGLDLLSFAEGAIKPVIDFNSLSMLTLESCACLEEAFPLLTGSGSGRRKAKSALQLHTLAIRHENTADDFVRELEIFLLSLKPLAHLHILLEGAYTRDIKMEKVLRVHGSCLQSLIWDERSMPRGDLYLGTAVFPEEYETWELIAKHCPELKALGISLDWEDITGSENNHKKIASSFSRMSQLQTLNVRNLPPAKTSETWLPIDYMLDGLATMLLNIVTKKARTLKTLAIGASTYGSVRVGMGHYTPNSASTFLQLRIYHINYDCRYRNSITPKLHLIGRGTPADAWGEAENLDIFTLYWLDGIPWRTQHR